MKRHRIRDDILRPALVLAGLALFGTVLSMPEFIRGRGGPLAGARHVEVVLLGIAIWLLALPRRRHRSAAVLRWAAGMITGYLVGFSLVETGIQYVYSRPFAPPIDIPMVRSLIQLALGPVGIVADILTPVVVGLVFVVFFALGIAGVSAITRVAAGHRRPGLPAAGATGVIVLLAGIAVIGDGGGLLRRPVVVRAVVSWADAPSLTLAPVTGVGAAEDDPSDEVAIPAAIQREATYRFPGLLDRDIYVFVVEAYGYATVSREPITRELRDERQAFSAALQEKGYEVVTSYLRSPVAGGFSWLAEATFLTGQWIPSQPAFEELYGAELPTLTGVLQEGGYHTFTVRPGTVHNSWPEGWDLYRFERSLVAHDGDFDYRGPWFSYVAITDQYALWAGHAYLEDAIAPGGAAADRPVLAYYQLVSSHTPFNRIPPIIEDWNELGDGTVYERRSDEIKRFNNSWTGGSELVEGYIAAISYVFQSLTKYVTDLLPVDRSPIVIVFGDHQAQRPIREPDAHLSTPIHIASRDPAILEAFLDRGFQRGMVSDEQPPHRSMASFFPLFLEVAR